MSAADGIAAGRLLVATPALVDPNFLRTVVLLLDVEESGALGVVLNRPSEVEVGSILPEWADRSPEPRVIFQGGPVSTDSALAVAWLRGDDEPPGFRPAFGSAAVRIGILDLDAPAELLTTVVQGLRIYAGYAGWGAGQLQAEVAEGSWVTVDSIPADTFGADPAGLWVAVLRRQPGELAWLATHPLDPTVN